jgi:hypothetical protein
MRSSRATILMNFWEIYYDLKVRYLSHVCDVCASGSRTTYATEPLRVRAFVSNPQQLYRQFQLVMSLA